MKYFIYLKVCREKEPNDLGIVESSDSLVSFSLTNQSGSTIESDIQDLLMVVMELLMVATKLKEAHTKKGPYQCREKA